VSDAARPFERVCARRELREGALLGVVLADGTRVCLVAHGGTVHAVSDRCPHAQFPLSDGEVDATGAVVCSWHGASFDCRTGRAVCGPLRGGGVREEPLGRITVYECRVEDDAIWVRPAPEPF
jgi:3-phenylpropionate/trans-cinnamate dioxygenase ferredoxin subunit